MVSRQRPWPRRVLESDDHKTVKAYARQTLEYRRELSANFNYPPLPK